MFFQCSTSCIIRPHQDTFSPVQYSAAPPTAPSDLLCHRATLQYDRSSLHYDFGPGVLNVLSAQECSTLSSGHLASRSTVTAHSTTISAPTIIFLPFAGRISVSPTANCHFPPIRFVKLGLHAAGLAHLRAVFTQSHTAPGSPNVGALQADQGPGTPRAAQDGRPCSCIMFRKDGRQQHLRRHSPDFAVSSVPSIDRSCSCPGRTTPAGNPFTASDRSETPGRSVQCSVANPARPLASQARPPLGSRAAPPWRLSAAVCSRFYSGAFLTSIAHQHLAGSTKWPPPQSRSPPVGAAGSGASATAHSTRPPHQPSRSSSFPRPPEHRAHQRPLSQGVGAPSSRLTGFSPRATRVTPGRRPRARFHQSLRAAFNATIFVPQGS